MALQVAERAVVGDEFEAIVGPLEATARTVSAIPTIADIGAQEGHPVVVSEQADPSRRLVLRTAELGETSRDEDFLLPFRVEVEQDHFLVVPVRTGLVRRTGDGLGQVGPQSVDDPPRLLAVRCQVGGPLAPALGDVDSLQEGGDHFAQLGEHQVRIRARLGQRVRAHAQEQLLVGLARPVDPDVRQRRRRQEAAERVERLGTRRLPVDEVAVTRLLGKSLGDPCLHHRQQLAVRVEDPVHLPHVARAVRRLEDLRRPVIAVLPVVEPMVVCDVARRLLQVRHEAAPLEHLGQHVRRLLARQVDAAELGHRIVAVLDEDALVELLRAGQADGGVDGRVPRHVEVADELVEEEPAQVLG